MGAAAIISAGATVANALKGGKTDERLAQNATNYIAAQAGNQAAVDALVARTGHGPAGEIGIGDGTTRDDAVQKLQALLNQGLITGPNPVQGAGSTSLAKYTITTKAVATGATISGAAPVAPSVTTAGTVLSGGIPLWLWLVAGAVSAFLYVKYGRKG